MVLKLRPADKIKVLVIEYITSMFPTAIIGSEVMYGTSRRVVDLLVLYEGKTYAIEIKSENDNTRRLSEQLNEYSLIFDYTLVITHPRHLDIIRKIAKKNVSIFEVEDNKIQNIRWSNMANKKTKYEMAYTISSTFLKKHILIKQKYNSDTIRRKIYNTPQKLDSSKSARFER